MSKFYLGQEVIFYIESGKYQGTIEYINEESQKYTIYSGNFSFQNIPEERILVRIFNEPKYNKGDMVVFLFKDQEETGVISSVNSYATNEISYDILSEKRLNSHVPESLVKRMKT